MRECRVVIEKVEVEKSGTLNDTALEKGQKTQPSEFEGRGKVKCDECGIYVCKLYLNTHKGTVHRGEKPFACLVTDCNERYSRPIRLADHKRLAHGYPKLKCKVKDCDSEFSLHSKFKSHKATHQSKIECVECGKMVCEAYLRDHIKFIHQGKSRAKCEISGCGKKFFNKADLADHMRSVHGFAKLKCNAEECTAEFSSRKRLAEHKKSVHV